MANSRTFKTCFMHNSDEWSTPDDLFNQLDSVYHFELDATATEQNAKCRNYFTKETDGLLQPWHGSVWCNPPYSNITEWVRKAVSEMQNGVTTVMLVPARTDTKWFHTWVYDKSNISIRFIKGRLKFGGSRENAPFPSMLIMFDGKGFVHEQKSTING